jgi:uncharacterized protein YodC (DUF2158 family)
MPARFIDETPVGEHVRLRSGGPVMLVIGYHGEEELLCAWHCRCGSSRCDGRGAATYPRARLERVTRFGLPKRAV